MEEKKSLKKRLKEETLYIITDMDKIHKDLKALQDRFTPAEEMAAQAGLDEVEYSLRDTFIKLSKSSQALVEAHLSLIIPPAVFEED